jgi:hypothetical protein
MAKNSLNGTNGHNGNGAKPEPTTAEKIAIMRREGWEQIFPSTERKVALRSVEPGDLLRSGECPDILTPLMLHAIFERLTDQQIQAWLERQVDNIESALKYMDTLDLIAEKGIADGTAVSDLTLGEKKWIFQLVLAPSETLVTFRYEPRTNVAVVAEEQPLPQAA